MLNDLYFKINNYSNSHTFNLTDKIYPLLDIINLLLIKSQLFLSNL